MPRSSIAEYFRPWSRSREKQRQQVEALRSRDGDDCRRCRRPMRFDLPRGHDLAPAVEPLGGTGGEDLANLCLCHGRCNRTMIDATTEVKERMRIKSEAALLSKSRSRRSKAA